MHARRAGARRVRGDWRALAAPGVKAARAAGRQRGRQARASERRFISSCVIRRCSVFSALPGNDMKRKPSW